jgi:hypothetical protein
MSKFFYRIDWNENKRKKESTKNVEYNVTPTFCVLFRRENLTS